MTNRKRWVGLVVLAGLLLVAAEGAAWAECGTCQVCRTGNRVTIPADWCGIANDEDGYLCCEQFEVGFATYCSLDGSACYGIIVGDGGGSGGGGGGVCSYQNGWCPAECMSCSGSGGRPAV